MAKIRAAGQLPLPVDGGWLELPRALRPMHPRWSRPFNSPDHVFEPVWGGLRALAFVHRRQVRLVAAPTDAGPVARGRGLWMRPSVPGGEVDPSRLPELAALANGLRADLAVLDGEVVVADDEGRADRAALGRRLEGRPGPAAVYLAFDLLYLDGRPLLAEPLEVRRGRLERTVDGGDVLLVVPAVVGQGRALLEAAASRGLAGVLGRARRSPYLPGLVSHLWRAVAAPRPGTIEPGRPAAPEGWEEARRSAPVLAVLRRLPLDLGNAG